MTLLLKYKLEIILAVSIIANVVLTKIILSDSKPRTDNSTLIDTLEQSNANLLKENDALKLREYKQEQVIESLKQEMADNEPNIIYINKKVDEIPHDSVTDSVLAILQRRIIATDTN